MKKDLDKILQAFSGKVLQSVNQVRKKLEKNDVSWAEFDKWIEVKKTELEPLRRCPECRKPLMLDSVNDAPETQIGGAWKSQWFCACGWSEFSENKPDKEMTLYKR